MKKQTTKNLLVLKGEGANSHHIEADVIEFESEKDQGVKEFSEVRVGPNGVLTHVDPQGKPAEHHTIPVEEGTWVLGRQCELNPFENTIGGVFD